MLLHHMMTMFKLLIQYFFNSILIGRTESYKKQKLCNKFDKLKLVIAGLVEKLGVKEPEFTDPAVLKYWRQRKEMKAKDLLIGLRFDVAGYLYLKQKLSAGHIGKVYFFVCFFKKST